LLADEGSASGPVGEAEARLFVVAHGVYGLFVAGRERVATAKDESKAAR
jgi:hypothetical protein